MQTNIVKWGNFQGIRLSKVLLDSANLTSNDTVDVIAEDGKIIIKKSEKKIEYKTIQQRFEGFEREYDSIDIEWGNPLGKEV